ncbi:MAG: FkbM family methyltransferase [Candidatus Pacebacteria bacterium]|nr:FkbM family methyltransferase [Candidatus Paceibacterota bacterium]
MIKKILKKICRHPASVLALFLKKSTLTIRKMRARILDVHFADPNYLFKGTFTKNSTLIDAGCGFDADFSMEMIRKYNLKAIGIDPTRKHQKSLATLSRKTGEKFTHRLIAISKEDGLITFNETQDNVSGSLLTSHNNIKKDAVQTYQVQSVSLARLPAFLDLPFIEYIKLDLEGAEYELIANLTKEQLLPYQQIFIEFHHHCTPYSQKDTFNRVEKMKSFGFTAFTLDDHNYLFYRPSSWQENKTRKIDSLKKIRVVFEQWILPGYRVPFFTELAKHVDLVLVVSKDKKIDGLSKAEKDLPFSVVALEENPPGENGTLYHPEIFSVLSNHHADIYASWAVPLTQIYSKKEYRERLGSIENSRGGKGVATVWTGCDGFKIQNFWKHLVVANFLGPKRFLKFLKDRIAMSHVSRFVVYSSHTKRFLMITKFIPGRKIRVAQNAIDISTINAKYNECKKKGLRKKPNSLIFSGRLTAGKGMETLLRALKIVATEIPNISLKIIGDGSGRQGLESLSEELNLKERVEFLGSIYDESTLCEHLSRATLFVMPGLGGLGFNTAMACGLPSVYTNADGTEKDLFEESGANIKCGWYFDGSTDDLAKKIVLALKDPEKLEAAGEAAEEKIVSRVTIKNMVDQYMKTFQEML